MTEAKTTFHSRRDSNTLDDASKQPPSDVMTTSSATAVVCSAELDMLDTFTLSETGGGKQAPSTATTPALAFGTMDDLDYSVISSGQTIENVFSTFLSERSGSIAEEGGSNNDVLDTDNSTQATNPQSAPTSSSQQQQPDASYSYSNGSMGAALEEHHRHYQNQQYQHQRPRQESFASINSTSTTEPLPQFQINHPHHPSGMPRSRPVSIPQPSSYQQQHHAPTAASSSTAGAGASGTVSQASSAGSSGSAFLNNILNPGATSNNTGYAIMAHTPPTYIATSYEASHFGKRPRANSISERLRYPNELEEKGLIDPHQKAILKDLIISGDNDLQLALDQYEQGNSSVLESMIRGGSINNRNQSDIDLLGDLDLDFLTVNDEQDMMGAAEAAAGGTVHSSLSHSYGAGGGGSRGARTIPGLSSTTANAFGNSTTMAPSSGASVTGPSDGIGELDFDGGFGGTMYNMPPSQVVRPEEAPSMLDIRSRSNSTWSVDFDPRHRSNSLFNALLGDTSSLASAAQAMEDQQMEENASNSNMDHHHNNESTASIDNSSEYGRWMEQRPDNPTKPIRIRKVSRRASAPEFPSNLSLSLSKSEQSPKPKTPKQYKKKNGQHQQDTVSMDMPTPPVDDGSDSPDEGGVTTMKGMTSTMSKEAKAEERGRVKQEKKEQRERERLEKKEKREQAKMEKQQKKKQDQIEAEKMAVVHIPGSGRPRSLSDSNLKSTVDSFGLLEVERPDGWIGAYSPESRKTRIERFMEKRKHRVWTQSVKYDVRKNFADSRLRVKGRFVKKEDELLMRELMSLT